MRNVKKSQRAALQAALQVGTDLSFKQRRALVDCLHMIGSLQADLKLSLAEMEGLVRDNNFLLVTALSQRALIGNLRGEVRKLSR